MTWNGSYTVTVKGVCAPCGKTVEKRVSVSSARQTKDINCGGWNCINELKKRRSQEKRDRLKAKGVKACRTGTILDGSKIQLRDWCFVFWLAANSEKGISAQEVRRETGISYKSAFYMLNRIRYALDISYVGRMTGTPI